MGYETIKMGALYLGDYETKVPKDPKYLGDIQVDNLGSQIYLKDAVTSEPITWIKPQNMDLLIADRTLLTYVSWSRLNRCGYIEGKPVTLQGLKFNCHVPHDIQWLVGLRASGVEGNDIWHWENMYFWGHMTENCYDDDSKNLRPVYGFSSSSNCAALPATRRQVGLGFRPVLEPIKPELLDFHGRIALEGQEFMLTLQKSGRANSTTTGVRPIIRPADPAIFAGMPLLSSLKAYTLLMDGEPVPQNKEKPVKYRTGSKLEFTDRYYGEGFLIPWTLFDQTAYATKDLLRGIKKDDLIAQVF